MKNNLDELRSTLESIRAAKYPDIPADVISAIIDVQNQKRQHQGSTHPLQDGAQILLRIQIKACPIRLKKYRQHAADSMQAHQHEDGDRHQQLDLRVIVKCQVRKYVVPDVQQYGCDRQKAEGRIQLF